MKYHWFYHAPSDISLLIPLPFDFWHAYAKFFQNYLTRCSRTDFIPTQLDLDAGFVDMSLFRESIPSAIVNRHHARSFQTAMEIFGTQGRPHHLYRELRILARQCGKAREFTIARATDSFISQLGD